MILLWVARHGLIVGLALLAGGCVLYHPVLPNAPLFEPNPSEMKRYQALAKKQDQWFSRCAESQTCAQVHFTRGLITLFEDREDAARHFRKVVALSPTSRLATSSKLWLNMIEESYKGNEWNRFLDQFRVEEERENLQRLSTHQLIRDVVNRDIIIQQLIHVKDLDTATLQTLQRELTERGKQVKKLKTQRKVLKAKKSDVPGPSIRNLLEQVGVRDKKIRELTSQLDALKRIDQEMREKTRLSEPLPITKTPLGVDTQKGH